MSRKVVVVGAGLGGSLVAGMLGRAGCEVDVYERRSDPRLKEGPASVGEGRSINLALSTRGLYALERVALADKVLAKALPMRGRMMHALDGALSFQPYSTDPRNVIYSVSRSGLNRALVEAAEALPDVRVRFGMACVGVDAEAGEAEFKDAATGEVARASADAVIGADGAYSAVCRALLRRERFDYSQTCLAHGYKELTIPPRGGTHAMDPSALHVWPRGGFMMIALPNPDGSFTGTLFWPHDGFASLGSEREVLAFFERTFPDAVGLMPGLARDFLRHPTGSLVTVRCSPWRAGRVALLGDACHAVVPFYGQGMNAAFEDCAVLLERLSAKAWDFPAAFAAYEEARKPDTDALAGLALANFVEMRDHVSSRRFLLKKRFEGLLHRLWPDWYVPLYTMVTFTRMPYREARERGARQEAILASLAAGGLFVAALVLAQLTFWAVLGVP